MGENRSVTSDPSQSVPERENRVAPVPEPGEFYYEGPYLVFTEAYHLRRGWCCQSNCRHCPYGFRKPVESDK
jgi:hypothetical protein